MSKTGLSLLSDKDINEKTIQNKLWVYFGGGYRYKFFNSFVYSWESDFFCMSRAGYGVDCEIKISLQDYKRDFEKPRHAVIKNVRRVGYPDMYGKKPHCPNRLYFILPKGIITASDIPDYAGYLELHQGVLKTVRKAPIIHRTKQDYSETLLNKIYWDYEREMGIKIRYGNR